LTIWQQIILGLIFAGAIAAVSYWFKALTKSGALAAWLLGTVVFGLSGWTGTALLMAFFTSSSALSRLFKKRKEKLDEKYAKGSRRDAWQVLANGGMAGGLLMVWFLFGKPEWAWLAMAASLAAVNADTWATELGVLSRSAPRRMTTGQVVPYGTSGAITLVGTGAALAGAAFVALVSAGVDAFAGLHWQVILTRSVLICLAGLFGSLVDSLLGDTAQAIYYCPACSKETERHPVHSCGTPTQQVRGWKWLNNDWVNFACGVSAAVLAATVSCLLP